MKRRRLLGLLAVASTILLSIPLSARPAHADSSPTIESIATQGCASDRVCVTLTVDNPVAGTITLKLTGHTPGSTDFVDTGAELNFTIVPGTTTYTSCFENVSFFTEPDFNTLRVEFKSTDIANLQGTTTKSVSFEAAGCIPAPPDDDLALANVPSDITADATGPGGVTVSYSLPTVTDPDDTSLPAATCAPASGSVFPIGTTTVHCMATDTDDTNSPVSASFTVHVKGAAEQLADLAQAVRGLGFGTGLGGTVAVAQQQVAAGHPLLACLTLAVFMFEVEAETPWRISEGTAARLIADATQIRAVLGCGSGLF